MEKGGKPLSNLFNKNISPPKSHRLDCPPCSNDSVKGKSMCGAKNVVYLAVCDLCEDENKLDRSKFHPGKYYGQTFRTLYERSYEHLASYRCLESCSFMFKHWAIHHPEVKDPPKFKFSVVNLYKSPLSRMIGEALKICEGGSMNSKSEFGAYKLKRIKIDDSDWQAEKQAAAEEKQAKLEENKMQVLRAKTQKSYLVTNLSDFSRIPSFKRKNMAESPVAPVLCEDDNHTLGENEPSPILKRHRPSETLTVEDSDLVRTPTSVKTKKGSWNPSRRSFKNSKNNPSVLKWLHSQAEKSSTPVKYVEAEKSSGA